MLLVKEGLKEVVNGQILEEPLEVSGICIFDFYVLEALLAVGVGFQLHSIVRGYRNVNYNDWDKKTVIEED